MTRVLPLLVLLAACTDEVARSTRALGGPDASLACGTTSYQGCCSGQTLRYCAGGKVVTQSCGPLECGWDPSAALYSCGAAGSADPSGKLPRPCPGDAGPSVDGLPAKADAHAVDGAKKGDVGEALDAGGCSGVPFVGCCSGATLVFCSGGQLLTLSCGTSATCGWRAKGGFYDCNTTGQPDPSGKHPLACAAQLKDGGLDAHADAGHDLGGKKDVGGHDQERLEGRAPRDGLSAGDQRRRDGQALDVRQREIGAGLDLTGLDGYRGDAGRAPGSSGCGCELAATADPALGLGALLLAACGAVITRGRRSARHRRS